MAIRDEGMMLSQGGGEGGRGITDICERMGFPPSLYPSPADGNLLN